MRPTALRGMARWPCWTRTVALVAALLPAAPQAEEATLSLMQAYAAARANDPLFHRAQAEREEGLQHEDLGRAKILPNVSAIGATNRNRAQVTNSNGTVDDRGDYSSNTASLQLRQPLFDLEAWAARNQGIARTAASEAAFRAREQELIVRVFEAYSKVLLAQEEVRLVEAQLQAVDEQLRANTQRLAQGEGTRTDLLETRSKQSLLRAQLVVVQDNHDNERKSLEALVGMPVGTLNRLRIGGGAVARVPGSAAEWHEQALRANGEVESLRQQVEAARQEAKRAEAGHYPRLALLVSAGQSDSDTISTFQQSSRTGMVGLQLSVPIYSGGAVSAQARQAVAQLSKAQAELDARVARLQVEVHRQHSIQHNNVQRIEALASAVETNYTLIEATRRSFIGGERTNLDVLTAQERLALAVRDLSEARYQQLLAGLRLRQFAGVLAETDLGAAASNFDGRPVH